MRNKKKMAVLLTLALCGWGGAAHAAEYTETIRGSGDSYASYINKIDAGNGNYTYDFGENSQITVQGRSSYVYGIGVENLPSAQATSITINPSYALDLFVEQSDNAAYGIFISGSAVDKAYVDRRGDGKITVNNQKGHAYGVKVESGNGKWVNIGEAEITANARGGELTFGYLDAAGLRVEGAENQITMENGKISTTAIYDAAVSGTAVASGILAYDTSSVDIGDVEINVKAIGNGSLTAYGVYSFNRGNVELGMANITAETQSNGQDNSASAVGIYASRGGQVTMKGGRVSATANNDGAVVYALYASGEDSNITVNQGTTNQLVVNGDIGNFEQATTNVTFNTVDSKFNGSVNLQGGTVNMTLANGAVWNNGAGFYKTITSNVSSLAMGGGVVHQQSAQAMTIQQYSGSGDILFLADDTAPDGVLTFDQTGDVVIGEAAAGSTVHLSVSNDTVDMLDSAKAEENLNAVANKLVYDANDENLTGTVTIDEGLITPEARGDLNFYTDGALVDKGYVTNIRRGGPVTATMEAMRGVGAIPILAWRQEDSAMSQRLGDLRRSKEGQSLWTRMSRGEFEYDGQYKNQYDFFQLGWDVARGSWHYGAAVSYNDGETTYAYGSGENSSASLSLYGTWLGEAGHYADIVLKGGRLDNEYDIYTEAGHTHGDYDMWGTSLSGEYGRKIALAGGWYVTPQAQLTVMHIGSEDYTTDNGIRVHQDGLSSAVGRAGLELGRDMGDRGSVYVKASLLHDFAGSAGTYLALNGVTNEYEQDIGDTWWEAGFGVDLRLSASSWLYADVMRTFGGDIDTPWQWNAGVRWGF